jgi:hypothetical protein
MRKITTGHRHRIIRANRTRNRDRRSMRVRRIRKVVDRAGKQFVLETKERCFGAAPFYFGIGIVPI